MTPADVYELRWAGDPRLSPDGTTVAFVSACVDRDANDYPTEIWLRDVGGEGAPRRFAFDGKRNAQPRWSPDGRRLAFTSDRDSEQMQLYVADLSGGDPQKLTDLEEDVTAPTWSPDGTAIAFVARVRDQAYEEEDERKRAPRRFRRLMFKLDNVGWIGDRRQHIFTIAADGSGEPRQLTFGDYEDSDPAWSPDGRRLAFTSARDDDWDTKDVSDIYVVEATGGEPHKITGSDGWSARPIWSGDGRSIAHHFTPGVLDSPRHAQIAVIGASGGERRVLTAALDRNCAPYPDVRSVVFDGSYVLFTLEDAGSVPLYRVRADGSDEPEPVIAGRFWLTGFDAVDGVIVTARTTPAHPPEIFSRDRKLSDVAGAFVKARRPSEPEEFAATSPDGTEVQAWLIRPTDFDETAAYPVLVNIHGGPFTQYGDRFFDEFQVYAAAGYAVVYCNPRGSSGYSEQWGRAIRGPVADGPGMGTVDYDDVMAVTDEALKRFEFCDPDRLGVMGGSYGGYLTSWIVGHTDRFTAACSERAVNDLYSFFGSSDIGPWAQTFIGAHPFDAPDAYRSISPTTYAKNIETPLLIMHSENDLRCDIEQAEHLFTILRLLGKDVELVRFPAEGHELSRSGSPIHRVMRFEILLEWFDRYLKRG